jgi:formylmethanofuran dehydrogenase subunit E
MLSVDEYITKASSEGPPMPGFILGIRMCLLGMKLLEIDEPSKYHRKLIAIVETDRCLPDVMELVLGCRLGNRTLKFRDWGKMAATFVELTRDRAVRLAALESVESEALSMFTGLSRKEALIQAYSTFADEKLLTWQSGVVKLSPADLPGYRAKRVACARCGEGIGFKREVVTNGVTLCRGCAGEAYLMPSKAV